MGVSPTVTKQILIQQTPLGDATVRTTAKLANVSIAEVIRQATERGLPLLLEEYGLSMADVHARRAELFPDVDASAPQGGVRLGNAAPRGARRNAGGEVAARPVFLPAGSPAPRKTSPRRGKNSTTDQA